MKKLIIPLIVMAIFGSGCTILRYNFEPALNSVPKDAKITKLTNDYVEYSKQHTNTTQVTNVVSVFYRAYYDTEGRITNTKQINNTQR